MNAAKKKMVVMNSYCTLLKEGIECLRKLIWHLETYDVTSVRASVPMYFLSEKISSMGIKVVLSGEGADEIFGGYLYFHNAPSDEQFQQVASKGKIESP